MGTKVQCKSYIPGYYFMRDLNEDADSGRWPVYHEDKMMMGKQFCNGFLPRPATDGHLAHDREVLRRTMLMHEATFKNQVAELHRLYRIQRNLMEELKRKEVHNYQIPVGAPQLSHACSSQTPFESAPKMWDISGKPSCSRSSLSVIDASQSPSELIKSSSMQGRTIPNGSFKDCRLSDSNSKSSPRRMFDLQLPADQYIDSEEGEHLEEGKRFTLDVNLSFGSGENPKFQGDYSCSDLSSRKQNLADLNHPTQSEEAASSASFSSFLGPGACHNDRQVQDILQQCSGSRSLPREFFRNTPRGMDTGAQSNILHLENMSGRVEWPSFNLSNGQSSNRPKNLSQGFGPDEFPRTSKPMQDEFRNTQFSPFLLDGQLKRGSLRDGEKCAIEMPERGKRLIDPSFPGVVLVPDRPTTYPAAPEFSGSGPSSSFSTWKKPTGSLIQSSKAVPTLHSPITSLQLSKISEPSIQKNGLTDAHWLLNGHLRSNTSSGRGLPYPNGFLHRSQNELSTSEDRLPSLALDYLNCSRGNASTSVHLENCNTAKYFRSSECMDVKSAKDLNLNISIPNGLTEMMVPQQERSAVDDGKRKNKNPVGGLPWLRTKPSSSDEPANGMGGSDGKGFCPSQSWSHQSTPELGIGKVLSPNSVQDSSSTPIACDTEDQRIQKSDSSGKRILGFPIFDKPHTSKDYSSPAFSSKLQRLSEVEIIENDGRPLGVDLICDQSLVAPDQKRSSENVAAPKELEKGISRVKYEFNLNSCAEEEEPSTYSMHRENVRIEIDLEAPAVPEAPEIILPGEESQIDQHKISAHSSQVELVDPSDEFARIAAEAIAIISLSGFCYHSKDITSHPSGTSLNDSLRWFADIVSSHAEGLDGKNEIISREKDNNGGESSSSDSGYFEAMTLKLTETKVDEYACKPWAKEPPNEEEACVTSLVPTRRRRGQGKRGRQRRDFQRDILPGLASLSRHEVSEDIQVIGGLMRATGHQWQTGSARRNAGRNGWARGRRRTRNVAPAVVETIVCSPPRLQANNSELGLEERSLTGWGKTTRRPRRQRLAAGNISIPITQV